MIESGKYFPHRPFDNKKKLFPFNLKALKSILESENERKIERRSKLFEREREREVLKKLRVSASANFPPERERSQKF